MTRYSPPLKIERHPSVTADLKRLRRFRTIEQSLEYFENLLSDGYPNMGTRVPIFGDRAVFKGDLHVVGLGKQGRGAGRVVYEKLEGLYRIVYVYAKSEDIPEHRVMREVKGRLGV